MGFISRYFARTSCAETTDQTGTAAVTTTKSVWRMIAAQHGAVQSIGKKTADSILKARVNNIDAILTHCSLLVQTCEVNRKSVLVVDLSRHPGKRFRTRLGTCMMDGHLGAAAPSFAAAAAGTFVAVMVLLALFDVPPNRCSEGSEEPRYEWVREASYVENFPPHYRLFRVFETSSSMSSTTPSATVMFVPGHGGFHTQAKSLAAEAAKSGIALAYYTIDYGNELSAFGPVLLHRQAQYARFCAELLISINTDHDGSEHPLLAVGHSMGGVVLRLASLISRKRRAPLSAPWILLATLGSPHYGPVIATEAGIWGLYKQLLSSFEEISIVDDLKHAVDTISISGGKRDLTVHNHLSIRQEADTNMGVVGIPASAIGSVQGSVDHKCLTWCLELIHPLNIALIQHAELTGRQHSAPDAALAIALDTLKSERLTIAAANATAASKLGLDPLVFEPGRLWAQSQKRWSFNGALPPEWHRVLALQGQFHALPQQVELRLACRGEVHGNRLRSPNTSAFLLDGLDRGQLQDLAAQTQKIMGWHIFEVDYSAYCCSAAISRSVVSNDLDVRLAVASLGGCSEYGWELDVISSPRLFHGLAQIAHQKSAALFAVLVAHLLVRLALPALFPLQPRRSTRIWPRLGQAVVELSCWLVLVTVAFLSADCNGGTQAGWNTIIMAGSWMQRPTGFQFESCIVGVLLSCGLQAVELWLAAGVGIVQRLLCTTQFQRNTRRMVDIDLSRWVGWAMLAIVFPNDTSWHVAVGTAAALAAYHDQTVPAATVCWRDRQVRPALCLTGIGATIKLPGLFASFMANISAVRATWLQCTTFANNAISSKPLGGYIVGSLDWVLATGLSMGARCKPEAFDILRWSMLSGWPSGSLAGTTTNVGTEFGDRLAFLLFAWHFLLIARTNESSSIPVSSLTTSLRPAYCEATIYSAAAIIVVSGCCGQGIVFRIPWVVGVSTNLGFLFACKTAGKRSVDRNKRGQVLAECNELE